MKYVFIIAHKVLKYAWAFWLTLFILPLIQMFWNNVLAPAKDFPSLLSKSIIAVLFLPGLNLALTLSTFRFLVLLNISAWIITLIEKRTKEEPRVSPKAGSPEAQWKGFDTFIFTVVWSPNESFLASAGSEGIVQLWSGKTYRLVKQLAPEGEPVDWLLSLAWSLDSQFLIAAGEDKESRIWNVETGTVQKIFRHSRSPILSLGWSEDGIGAIAETGWSAFLAFPISDVWQQLSATTSPIQRATWAWHADMLAIVSVDGELLVQDRSALRRIARFNPDMQQVQVLSWNGTNTHLAVGCKDGRIQVWDINQAKKVAEWNSGQQDIRALSWTLKGSYLISGDDNGIIKVWHISKGKLRQEFNTSNGPITALAISPSTGLLCSAHERGILAIWKLRKRLK